MKVKYFDHWWRDTKEGQDELQYLEAELRFNQGKHFFALIFMEKNKKPSYFLEFLYDSAISVSYLNQNLEEELTLNYQILKGNPEINENKLFMVQFIHREIMPDGKQLKGSQCNSALFTDKGWKLQEYFHCEEDDFEKGESYSFASEVRVNVEELEKEIPKFGEWEELIQK